MPHVTLRSQCPHGFLYKLDSVDEFSAVAASASSSSSFLSASCFIKSGRLGCDVCSQVQTQEHDKSVTWSCAASVTISSEFCKQDVI